MYSGQTTISEESRQKLFEAIELLNTFLEGKTFVAGSNQPTIADLSIFSSVANIIVSTKEAIEFSWNFSIHE